MNDLKFAFCQLLKSPGFTAVVVLSLALGIGANSTVLCWIRAILLQPIPGAIRQEEIVGFLSNQGSGNTSLPDIRDLGSLNQVFAGAVASQISPASLTADDRTEWIYGQVATANFFDLLGVKQILGRTFLPDEDLKPGGNPVLVLSETLWRGRFGGNSKVVGQVVELNRHAFTVVGVVPAAFRGTMTGLACGFWAPISMYKEVGGRADNLAERQSRGLHNLARLQPGVSLAQACAAVATLDTQLALAYPDTNREVHHRVVPYSDVPYGAQNVLGSALRLLLAVTVGVLLIVAANVASLLLTRATGRQKEIAIRLAAGAGRARLIRQLLTESLALALLGGLGGVVLASWGVTLLGGFLPATNLPVVVSSFTLDWGTLGITLLLTLATGLAFGLVPALQASRLNLYETLKEGGRSSGGAAASHHRLRQAFVVAQVALSLVLLVGAGLCLKGLQQARAMDLGLNPDRVLIAGLQIGMNGYTEATGKGFYRRLQQRLAATPGVQEATLASWLPLGLAGCKGHGVDAEGYQRRPGENPTYEYAIVAPRYFTTLRIPLIDGRDFTDRDDADAPRVAIINEAFAQRFWPGQNPIGRKFRAGGEERQVVGVAKTGKYNRLSEQSWSFFYLPYQQYVPDLDLSVVVRTRGDPAAFARTLSGVVRELDPGVALWGTMRMTDHVAASLFVQRTASSLLTVLSTIALTLAAMGVYAVMAYAVSQRTQEFGVRMALGAQVGDVVRQVLRQGLVLVALGTATGIALALAVTHWLGGFLYGVSPFDPLTFVGVPLLLGAVALLACWLPARRAARVDPMEALRCE